MTLLLRESTDTAAYATGSLHCLQELMRIPFRLCGGVPVPHPFPECLVELETKPKRLPDFFCGGQAKFVSEKFRSTIESFQVPAEYIDVKLVRRGKMLAESGYYLLNPLDVVDCFDYDRSEYTPGPRGVKGIAKLVIDESKTSGHHLFRVGPIGWAHLPPNPKAVGDLFICASEELAARSIDAGITGAVFSPPERVREFPPPEWLPRPAQ